MPDIEETSLPGVGIRHALTTQQGDRLAVITHRTGRRELVVYDRDDPDASRVNIHLEEDESHTLAELLGGTTVTEHLGDVFRQSLEGLTIEWLTVGPQWACTGRTVGDMQLRTRTGVSVIAVIRDGQAIPAPGPDQRLQRDDAVVAVGTPEGLRQAASVLRAGA